MNLKINIFSVLAAPGRRLLLAPALQINTFLNGFN